MAEIGGSGGGRRTSLLLLRHGETLANASGILQGQSESDLTEYGRAQAKELGTALKARLASDPNLVRDVYTSDLCRTVDTAQAVADAIGGCKLHKDARLRERRLGPFQGLSTKLCVERFPKTWTAFTSGAFDGPAGSELPVLEPGGEDVETAASMGSRCMQALDDIASSHPLGATILVVSHGGLIHTAVNYCCQDDQRHVPNIGNVSITTLIREGGEQWQVQRVGEAVVSADKNARRPERNVDVAPAPSKVK